MSRYDVKILDCTLRDGGYINDWKWGYESARDIIFSLVKSGVEMVEVGFLRNIESYNEDITISNRIEDLNKLLPCKIKGVMFSAMAMQSNYDVEQLSPYQGTGIEMIRVTAHDYDLNDGLRFAKKVMEKGYKVSFNPINIKGYSDAELLQIFEKVNSVHPFQFSIVDTFGSMKKRDLDRIIRLADNNISPAIRLGLHLHENILLSCCLAQNFIDMHLNRPIVVDGSLMGMGRSPGNLPIELIADYLNDYAFKCYDINFMLDAIQDYIKKYKGECHWGYSPEYFLSARYNIHRNYAEHLLKKGDLTCKDINYILAQVERHKATVFDEKYADEKYEAYKDIAIDDSGAYNQLKKIFEGKGVLIIAPGSSINNYGHEIMDAVEKNNLIVISLNFVTDKFKIDYAFFSNRKRIHYLEKLKPKTIFTSNLLPKRGDYIIDYNRISGDFSIKVNSLILLLRLLKNISVSDVFIAGADGYSKSKDDYFSTRYKNDRELDKNYNQMVADSIRKIGLKVNFITPSKYNV